MLRTFAKRLGVVVAVATATVAATAVPAYASSFTPRTPYQVGSSIRYATGWTNTGDLGKVCLYLQKTVIQYTFRYAGECMNVVGSGYWSKVAPCSDGGIYRTLVIGVRRDGTHMPFRQSNGYAIGEC